jgi:hypothetical protein
MKEKYIQVIHEDEREIHTGNTQRSKSKMKEKYIQVIHENQRELYTGNAQRSKKNTYR